MVSKMVCKLFACFRVWKSKGRLRITLNSSLLVKFGLSFLTKKANTKINTTTTPNDITIEKMHHMAHENCFIANSVKTEVTTLIAD